MQVEAVVFREGLNLAIDLSVNVLDVESNSQLLVRYSKDGIRPISSLATINDIDICVLFQ